ncbi:hypothetical protein [Bradyrhizobium sp. RT6a]|uniref:hypothetical protein n=1 Tax=Bradyrhizobium sp. RT6a TaxID=3156381 RepID=UPI0033960706
MSNLALCNILRQANQALCAVLIALQISTGSAYAQDLGKKTAPIYGGTGVASQSSDRFQGMSGTYAPVHKTPDGQACISVHPMARPQTLNPKIIDQVVLVANICGQSIRIEVCYAGSKDCIIVPLVGYQKLQRTLGVAPGSTSFRYQYRELY